MQSFKDLYDVEFLTGLLENPNNLGYNVSPVPMGDQNVVSLRDFTNLKPEYFSHGKMGEEQHFESDADTLLGMADWCDNYHIDYTDNYATAAYFAMYSGEWDPSFKMDVLAATTAITRSRDYFDGASWPFMVPSNSDYEYRFPFFKKRDKLVNAFSLSITQQEIMQRILINKAKEGLVYNSLTGDGHLYISNNNRVEVLKDEVPFNINDYYDQHELEQDETYLYRAPMLSAVDRAKLNKAKDSDNRIIVALKLLGWWNLTDTEINSFKNWQIYDAVTVEYKHSIMAYILSLPIGDIRIAAKNANDEVIGWFNYYQRYDGNPYYYYPQNEQSIDSSATRLIFKQMYGGWFTSIAEQEAGHNEYAWPGMDNVPTLPTNYPDAQANICKVSFTFELTHTQGASVWTTGEGQAMRYRDSSEQPDEMGTNWRVMLQLRDPEGNRIASVDDNHEIKWYRVIGDDVLKNGEVITVGTEALSVDMNENNMTIEHMPDGAYRIDAKLSTDAEDFKVGAIITNKNTGLQCAIATIYKDAAPRGTAPDPGGFYAGVSIG